MPDGDSTDYDSLPSPPLRGSTFRARGGTRQYGKRAVRVAPAPRELEGRSGKRGFERGQGGGESSSGSNGEGGMEKGRTRKKPSPKRAREKAKKEVVAETAKEDEEEQVGGKKRKGGTKVQPKKKKKSLSARAAFLPPDVESLQPSPPLPARAVARDTLMSDGSTSKKMSKSRKDEPQVTVPPPKPTSVAIPVVPAARSPASLYQYPPSNFPRIAPDLPDPSAVSPPPRRPSQTAKTHLDSTLPLAQSLAQHLTFSAEAQMTPRSRARALRDKSNRRSLAEGGRENGSTTSRSALSRGVDSPGGINRRGSLAVTVNLDSPGRVAVFRDPGVPSIIARPPSRLSQPSAAPAPSLTDLPPRRRPLSRTHSQPLVPTSSTQPQPRPPSSHHSTAGGALPLPRSPGGAPLRAVSASPRLPLLSRQRPRAAVSSSLLPVGTSSLAVPGAPVPGQVPRLPAPWALAAPPTSSPASFAQPTFIDGGNEDLDGGEGPVFRFTTTQFADLPSFALSTKDDDGEEGSSRVGMESSFVLFEDESGERSGEVWREEEGASMAVDEVEKTAGPIAVDGREQQEMMQEMMQEKEDEAMDVDSRFDGTAVDAHDEQSSDAEKDGEADQTVLAVASDSHSITLSHSAAAFSLPGPDSLSPSSPPIPSSPPALPTPPTPFNYTSHFMPPRRSRSVVSAPLPSGPPSSEDDLAYYLRTTGTFSSEDDLSPSPPRSAEEGDESAEENRRAEREVGRAMKPSSRQRMKRMEAHDAAARLREGGLKGLRIGEGKEGRRRGWKREILSPVRVRGREGVVRAVSVGGYDGGDEDEDEEDELSLAIAVEV